MLIVLHCQKPNTHNVTLQIMTFNIRYNNPDDGINTWSERKLRVAETIRFHQCDIACLQEALYGQVRDLQSHLPEYAWFGVGRDDGDRKGEFAPVFYRRDRFGLLESGHFWLSQEPDRPGTPAWDAACRRIVTWGKLKDRFSSKAFIVYNTHFDHMGKFARLKSAELILKKVKDSGDIPLILTGDFNCTAGSPPYQLLASQFSDVHETGKFHRYGSTQTYNGFKEFLNPGQQIDFIFVRNVEKVLINGVISDRWDGQFVSDHNAVIAEVSL
jgi:endonuclease/exonuclease/phosphatase family metal-dependent hydrolase